MKHSSLAMIYSLLDEEKLLVAWYLSYTMIWDYKIFLTPFSSSCSQNIFFKQLSNSEEFW